MIPEGYIKVDSVEQAWFWWGKEVFGQFGKSLGKLVGFNTKGLLVLEDCNCCEVERECVYVPPITVDQLTDEMYVSDSLYGMLGFGDLRKIVDNFEGMKLQVLIGTKWYEVKV